MGVKRGVKRTAKTIVCVGMLLCAIGGIIMAKVKQPENLWMRQEWPIIAEVAREYGLSKSDTTMLLAIRRAEWGGAGYEFGVKAAKGTDLKTQAQWAAGSIRANRKRFQQLQQQGYVKGNRRTVGFSDNIEGQPYGKVNPDIDFPEYMAYWGSPAGYGWAPIHSPDMPEKEIELNKSWSKNVRSLTQKYDKLISQGGIE